MASKSSVVVRGADAVFILSHVHCPVSKAQLFRDAAKWILPRCRLRETPNGQAFEHLHARLGGPTGPDAAAAYAYRAAASGFEPRNVGRGASPALRDDGGSSGGGAVEEFVWFEEWRDWSGVALHGETSHGTRTHAAIDGFIEEEWTFYTPCRGASAAPLALPPPAFFNAAHGRARGRGEMVVAHLRLAAAAAPPAGSEAAEEPPATAEREALLAHFGASGAEPGGVCAALASGGAHGGGGEGGGGGAGETALLFAMLLESRTRPREFALVAEAPAGPPALALATAVEARLASAPCALEHSGALRFGAPLWPEDMALTLADIDAQSDTDTFPL